MNFKVEFSISDDLLPLLDGVRDQMSRDDLFRKAIELGIGDLIENAFRMNRDYLNHRLAGDSKDYRQARAMLCVGEPEKVTPQTELTQRRAA
jgi:hypothetical protein